MDSNIEEIARHLPPYLLPKQREQLFTELRSFPEKANYFLNRNVHPDEVLQGDGWGSLHYFEASTGKEQNAKGLILSNSCDVARDNQRTMPVRVLFSPLLRLDLYIKLIAELKGPQAAQGVMDAIRAQKITSIFYLPACDQLPFESIAVLDNVVSIPLDMFFSNNPGKFFCLSQLGFYLFVIKLSIHLTRFQEGIARFDA